MVPRDRFKYLMFFMHECYEILEQFMIESHISLMYNNFKRKTVVKFNLNSKSLSYD